MEYRCCSAIPRDARFGASTPRAFEAADVKKGTSIGLSPVPLQEEPMWDSDRETDCEEGLGHTILLSQSVLPKAGIVPSAVRELRKLLSYLDWKGMSRRRGVQSVFFLWTRSSVTRVHKAGGILLCIEH